jgi:hypothetical protein
LKAFVCFIKQACLLAIISKFGEGVDDSILWLSFAQQKERGGGKKISLKCRSLRANRFVVDHPALKSGSNLKMFI